MLAKFYKISCTGFFVFVSSLLILGCETSHPVSSDEIQPNTAAAPTSVDRPQIKNNRSGVERTFTNANVVMWVPYRAVRVWDGHTSVIDIDETTAPNAFVKDYKNEVEIQLIDTQQRIKQFSEWASSDWYFQEHPELSVSEGQYGIQIRKDIWDPERSRRILLNAMVKKSETFQEDVITAKKMVASVRLVGK